MTNPIKNLRERIEEIILTTRSGNTARTIHDQVIGDLTNLLSSELSLAVKGLISEASEARHEAGQLGLDPNATMDSVFEALDSKAKEILGESS